MHHANYCTDFEKLQEMFNLQFDINRSIDSIEVALHENDDDEFFAPSTEAAESYRKWYTEHPTDPVSPISLLACRAIPIEQRAYLAYNHNHGTAFDDDIQRSIWRRCRS